MDWNGLEWVKMVQDGLEWFRMVMGGQGQLRMVQDSFVSRFQSLNIKFFLVLYLRPHIDFNRSEGMVELFLV